MSIVNGSNTTPRGLPVWHLSVLCVVSKRLGPKNPKKCVDDENWKKSTEQILTILELHGIEYVRAKDYQITTIAGGPMPDKSNTERLVRATLAIQSWLNRMRISGSEFPFEIRMGIHTDIVIAGIVASARMPHDLYGHTRHLAERLARAGSNGSINISEPTCNYVNHLFECDYWGSLDSMGEIHKPSRHIFDKAVKKIPHFRTGWVGMHRVIGEKPVLEGA